MGLEEDRVKFRQKSSSATEDPDETREVKSLSCHVSVPQDVEVDFKRLSTCSIDSSSVDHLPLSTFDKYLIANESDIHWISDSEFYIEIAGLNANISFGSSGIADPSSIDYKSPSKVTFSNGKMRVYSTYGPADYDRRNDDIDPISASAEYELERRLEKMDIIDLEIVKGGEGLGISIIGMGVGADAGLEKLGIFIKSITPGGAVFRDGRIHVCDQIVEVDNKSLVGVSQTYAASVLRSTDGVVKFKLGREKDLDISEIAQLIRQSLEQDHLANLREQEILARRLNISNDVGVERSDAFSPPSDRKTAPASFDRSILDENRHSTSNSGKVAQPPDRLDSSFTSSDSVFGGGGNGDDDHDGASTVANASKVTTSTGDGEIDFLISELRKSDESGRLYEYDKVDEKIDSVPHITVDLGPAEHVPTTVFNLHNETPMDDLNRPNEQFRDQISKDSGLDSNQPSHEKINRHPFFEKKHYSMELSDDEDKILCRRIHLLENTLGDVKREAEKYQHLLIDSQSHYIDLERRYDSARKRIKDYQDRERALVEREETHLKELRGKDTQYSHLFRQLNEKVLYLENQLSDAQKKRSSLIETNGSSRGSVTDRGYTVLDGGTVSAMNSNDRTVVNATLTDVSPALAYLPSKKFAEQTNESTWPKKSQPDNKTRSVSFDTQIPSTSALPDEDLQYANKVGYCNFNHFYDFGVPETVLLDNTAAKSKVEAVKQSTTMCARSLPSRHADAEVFVLCHHTMEHAEMLKRHPTHVITEDLEQTMLGGDIGCDKLTEVLHWNCDEVSNFLKTIGMSKYVQDFMRNRIDGCKLLQLDGAKLKGIGISDTNDRALIKKRVKQMKLVLEKERKKETKKLLNISLPDKDRRLLKH